MPNIWFVSHPHVEPTYMIKDLCPWNISGNHKRKLICSDGAHYLDNYKSTEKDGIIYFTGEWECCSFFEKNRHFKSGSTFKNVHEPIFTELDSQSSILNTDPFVLGKKFYYVCCGKNSKMNAGDIVIFGTTKKGFPNKLHVDTVLVLEGKVNRFDNQQCFFPSGYNEVTLSKVSLHEDIWVGQMYEDDQDLFSFVPCKMDSNFSCPIIEINYKGKYLHGGQATNHLSIPDESDFMDLYEKIIGDIISQNYKLGVYMPMPKFNSIIAPKSPEDYDYKDYYNLDTHRSVELSEIFKRLNINKIMKKFLFSIIVLMFTALPSWAYDFAVDGMFYNVVSMADLTVKVVSEDDTYTKSYSGDVVIPDSIVFRDRTFNVIAIESKAFMNCPQLTSVSIPKSVSIIGKDAFKGSDYIEKITIEDGDSILLTNYSFQNLSILTLYQGRNVDSYFNGCKNLKSVTLGSKVTVINEYAFQYCSSLTEIVIPNSVSSIGNKAFNGCSSLAEITIPNSVNSIGEYVFNGCSSLAEIVIPNSVNSIGEYAFNGCAELNSISLTNKIIEISTGLFCGCTKLSNIVLPSSVTTIKNKAFEDCTSLQNIIIPNSVTLIGDYVFKNCSSFTNIEIPNSVASLGKYAFYGCVNLNSIKLSNNITELNEGVFSDCTNLLNVEMSDKIHLIRSEAFYNCKSLANIVIPGMVTEIEAKAFEGCVSLENLKIDDYVSGSGYVNENLYKKYISDKCITVYLELDSYYPGFSNIYCYAWIEKDDNTVKELLGRWSGARASIKKINGNTYAYYTFPENIKRFNIIFSEYIDATFSWKTPDINDIRETTVFRYYGYDYVEDITIDSDISVYNESVLETNNNFANSSLKSVYLGRDIFGTFENNINLNDVTISSGVSKISTSLFSGCSSLCELTIPSSVESIFSNAFKDCTSLRTLTLSDGSKLLGVSYYALENCSLTSLRLGRNIYGNYAFGYQKNITSLNIGPNVSTIEEVGFENFTNLKKIVLEDSSDSISIGNILANSPLETIYIGRNGSYKFKKETIQKVIFGEKVSTIPSDAFSSCVNIINVYSLNSLPPKGGVFNAKTYINGTLYVNKGSKEAYMKADGWKDFWEIVEIEGSSAIEDIHEDNSIETNENVIEYYNLQGVKVAKENLAKGVYIKKQGGKSVKVLIK